MNIMPGLGYRRRHAITRVKAATNLLSRMNAVLNNNKRKHKRKHKKKSKGTGCGNNIDLSNSTSAFHGDCAIECEILSRLPAKSLVRFKCVCKRWKLLIEEDSYFVDLHLNQSKKRPALLFFFPRQTVHGGDGTTLLYNRLDLVMVDLVLEDKQRAAASATSISTKKIKPRVEPPETFLITIRKMMERPKLVTSISTLRKMEFPYLTGGCFGPVNGLIGFYSEKYSRTCICNVSTQRVSPWIKSTLPKNVENKGRIPHYEMGFDPATKKHKVICIWRKYDSNTFSYNCICEVLTVGENRWRRIHELPPFELEYIDGYYKRQNTVYVNGFIYYCTSTFTKAGEFGYDKIVAFDVGAEKFRVITVPDFILDQPRDVYDLDSHDSNHLIELEGRLALISNMSGYTTKLWVFNDAHENTSTSSSSNQSWTEVTIKLPCAYWRCRFHSVVGTDKIIIEETEGSSSFKRHLYNCTTKSCQEIDISGFEYHSSISRVSTLVESLFDVQ